MAEEKTTKKISAKTIMMDLKAGMSDAQLMSKYDISFQGLQTLFEKLVKAGLATQSYFDKRATQQTGGQAKGKTLTCPYCGFTGSTAFRECPRCHQDVSEWLDTMELTNILTGSFGD
jgi:rubrerythrin